MIMIYTGALSGQGIQAGHKWWLRDDSNNAHTLAPAYTQIQLE